MKGLLNNLNGGAPPRPENGHGIVLFYFVSFYLFHFVSFCLSFFILMYCF